METDRRTNEVVQAAKEFWPYYAPAWAFPLALYALTASGSLNHTSFNLVVLPVFLVTFGGSAIPWMRRKVAYWPQVFWTMCMPFMIWVIAVFGIGLTMQLMAKG